MSAALIVTLGCRLDTCESEVVRLPVDTAVGAIVRPRVSGHDGHRLHGDVIA